MKSNLKLAMERFGAGDYADPTDTDAIQAEIDANRASYEAITQADYAAADARRLAAHEAEMAAEAARRETARRELMRAEAAADAIVVIARAKARAGHDLTAWTPSEAQHVLNAYEMFSAAQSTPAPDLPDAFKGESDPGAVARGAAVGAILGGGQ